MRGEAAPRALRGRVWAGGVVPEPGEGEVGAELKWGWCSVTALGWSCECRAGCGGGWLVSCWGGLVLDEPGVMLDAPRLLSVRTVLGASPAAPSRARSGAAAVGQLGLDGRRCRRGAWLYFND